MPFVPNANVIRIVVDWAQPVGPANNVFYCSNPGPVTAAVVETAAEDFRSVLVLNMLPVMSSDIDLVSVTAYSMESETAPLFVSTTGLPAPGALTSDLNASAFSVISTLYTQNRGRSGRGRIYWPGATEEQVADGELTTAAMSDWGAAVGAFLAGAVTIGFPLVVYSQFTGGAPRTTGLAQLVTTATIRSPRPGQQRRRNHRP